MKSISIFIGFITTLVLSSCNKESDVLSVLHYEDQTLMFSHCLMEDWGAHTGTHYNMDFTIIGESVYFEKQTDYAGRPYFVFSDSVDFFVLIELFSPGTEQFTTGTFRKKSRDESFEEIAEEYIYRRFLFGTAQENFSAIEGNVKLVAFKNGTIRITFDVLLNNDNRVSGTYEGIPEYVEGYIF
ncbi:hypothetical protein [Marinoscillum sp. MHG1-6]|uniref:hypothetical protein n=1 Tax=Marinoscillum sp. MHG1-6 TaxID=2959627 RepID=UPI002157FCC5|nr:hypothetical protein [Marinoscillum sp. MHG1-6]